MHHLPQKKRQMVLTTSYKPISQHEFFRWAELSQELHLFTMRTCWFYGFIASFNRCTIRNSYGTYQQFDFQAHILDTYIKYSLYALSCYIYMNIGTQKKIHAMPCNIIPRHLWHPHKGWQDLATSTGRVRLCLYIYIYINRYTLKLTAFRPCKKQLSFVAV